MSDAKDEVAAVFERAWLAADAMLTTSAGQTPHATASDVQSILQTAIQAGAPPPGSNVVGGSSMPSCSTDVRSWMAVDEEAEAIRARARKLQSVQPAASLVSKPRVPLQRRRGMRAPHVAGHSRAEQQEVRPQPATRRPRPTTKATHVGASSRSRNTTALQVSGQQAPQSHGAVERRGPRLGAHAERSSRGSEVLRPSRITYAGDGGSTLVARPVPFRASGSSLPARASSVSDDPDEVESISSYESGSDSNQLLGALIGIGKRDARAPPPASIAAATTKQHRQDTAPRDGQVRPSSPEEVEYDQNAYHNHEDLAQQIQALRQEAKEHKDRIARRRPLEHHTPAPAHLEDAHVDLFRRPHVNSVKPPVAMTAMDRRQTRRRNPSPIGRLRKEADEAKERLLIGRRRQAQRMLVRRCMRWMSICMRSWAAATRAKRRARQQAEVLYRRGLWRQRIVRPVFVAWADFSLLKQRRLLLMERRSLRRMMAERLRRWHRYAQASVLNRKAVAAEAARQRSIRQAELSQRHYERGMMFKTMRVWRGWMKLEQQERAVTERRAARAAKAASLLDRIGQQRSSQSSQPLTTRKIEGGFRESEPSSSVPASTQPSKDQAPPTQLRAPPPDPPEVQAMKQRAEARSKRRRELADRYAAKQAEQARLEQARLEQAQQAEQQAKQEERRRRRAAELERERVLEAARQQLVQARHFYSMRLLRQAFSAMQQHCIRRQSMLHQAARAYSTHLLRASLWKWKTAITAMRQKMHQAAVFRNRMLAQRTLDRLVDWSQEQARRRHAVRVHQRRRCIAHHFCAWKAAAWAARAARRKQHLQEVRRMQVNALQRLVRRMQSSAFRTWHAIIPVLIREREATERQQDLWRRVRGWLDE